MNIGFDAKRAYHNTTGLGFYSRTLINLLAIHHPDHEYFLFNPKASRRYSFNNPHIHEILPSRFPSTLLRSVWRSKWVTGDLVRKGIDLYHGLSHEIPVGISGKGIKSVVTIHDLIHERFPQQYKAIDRKIYTRKYTYACNHADRIIAISQQTKQDLVDIYKIGASRIDVVYQSADPIFSQPIDEITLAEVSKKYKLPAKFILSVGTINERKNLLNVCKAMFLLRNELDIPPLVVIGKGMGTYYQSVKDFVLQHGLDKTILFLSESPDAKMNPSFLSSADLAAIYRLSTLMIYPSFFEGFGIPILEAMESGTPVITANTSSLPEVGGSAAQYVDPNSAEEMANAIRTIVHDESLAELMCKEGKLQAASFSPRAFADATMNVYKKVW